MMFVSVHVRFLLRFVHFRLVERVVASQGHMHGLRHTNTHPLCTRTQLVGGQIQSTDIPLCVDCRGKGIFGVSQISLERDGRERGVRGPVWNFLLCSSQQH